MDQLKPKSRQDRGYLPTLLILCVASILLLTNLGNQYLWQDEAQTALIAKTVMAHGIPLGTDGLNIFSQDRGAEYGEDFIWKYHTWFPFYLLAGFFGVFGISTFVARLPFALFGIATVVLTYYFALYLWKSRRAAVFSAVALLLSVPFMLLARQCRYYSPAVFFSVLCLYAYVRLIDGRKHAALTFLVSSILLFHTQYLHWGGLLATITVHMLIFHRRQWRQVLVPVVLSAVICLPWLVWVRDMSARYAELYNIDPFDLQRAWQLVSTLLGWIPLHVFLPVLIFLPLIAAIINRFRKRRAARGQTSWSNASLLLLFCLFTIVIPIPFVPNVFFRHLGPLIPVSCLLMGLILDSGARAHISLAAIGIVLLALWQPTPQYLYELTHDYDGPMEGICKYLNAHGKKTDIAAVQYEDLPVKFYTGMRVVGGLTGEDLSPARKARWVIIRRNYVGYDATVRDELQETLPLKDYRQIEIPYPDIQFENRESPDGHHFRTVQTPDKVVILERPASVHHSHR